MKNKIKFKKGDKVIILTGRDKGKTGVIERVLTKDFKVVAGGINIVKKHVKTSKKFPTGGVVEITKPIDISKIAIICPNCGKPTRIGYLTEGKEKNRVCKKCQKTIKKPKEESKEK